MPATADTVELRVEAQRAEVADEVAALTAVVRPILEGTLYALKSDLVAEFGGHANVKLSMLARLYRAGDGDCGICFEWAVHDAMRRGEAAVVERVQDALHRFCRVPGSTPASILFGAEKTGALRLIDTATQVLTDESRLLTGTQTQPPKLRRYLNQLAAALRRPEARSGLPYSISGLWKADLFLGNTDSDRWVGTSVKINRNHLEGARGIRIGIIPAQQGRTDRIHKDDQRNLIVCPLPYDGSFMEIFYQAWQIVQQFIAADAEVPKEVALPRAADRQVARFLAQRRDFPVVDVIGALIPLSQPGLLEGQRKDVGSGVVEGADANVGAVIAPSPELKND